MPKKIVGVNASPRKDWNTDTLLMEAAKGALYLQGRLAVNGRTLLSATSTCSGCFE